MNDEFMSGLKTIVSGFVAFTLTIGHASAMNDSQSMVRIFAECSGRLTAAVEHQRMFFGEASPDLEQAQVAMFAVLEAATPPDMNRSVISWRVSARAAQNALMSQATLSFNQQTSTWAQQRSDRLLADCQSFVIF